MGQVRILKTTGVLLWASDSAFSLHWGPPVESASSLKMCFPTSQTQFFWGKHRHVKPPLQLRIEELLKLRLLNAVHQARSFLSRLSQLPKNISQMTWWSDAIFGTVSWELSNQPFYLRMYSHLDDTLMTVHPSCCISYHFIICHLSTEALSYPASLLGYEVVHEAMADRRVLNFLKATQRNFGQFFSLIFLNVLLVYPWSKCIVYKK